MELTALQIQMATHSWCQSTKNFWGSTIPDLVQYHTFGQRSTSPDQVNTTLLIEDSYWSVRWIRIWDPRCLGEHLRKAFLFSGAHHGQATPG